MNNKIRITGLLLILIVIAIGAYFWATGSISSAYAYRSLLKDNPPPAGSSLGDAATNRVVIVLIDGLRYDTSLNSDIMPFLAELRKHGSSALMHSQAPSFSEPGYSTILTGAWPEINDGPALNLDYEEIPAFTQDNLFSAVHQAGMKTAISAYYWFEKLIPQSDVDFSYYTPGEDAAADNDVVNAAIPFLQNPQNRLVLVHIDQVDYAGHHLGGAQSAGWDASAKTADNLLMLIVNEINLETDTVIVLSDHGHIDAGGHGGQDAVVLIEPFVIAGKGTRTSVQTEINMVDVAPTIAALLGVRLPASAQGQVRTDLVSLTPSVLESLPELTEIQQVNLVTAYAEAIGKPITPGELDFNDDVVQYQNVISSLRNSKLLGERILRAIPASILLAVAIYLLWRKRKEGAFGWVIAALVCSALFNFRYAILSQNTYSLSSVKGEMELILYTAVTALSAFVIAYLLNMLINKVLNKKPVNAALSTLGLGYTTILVLALPVIISFVLNGVLITWTLPDYLTSYLSLIALIQILIISIATILFSGISALLTVRNKE
jgi:hypothetical protein